MKLKLWTMTFNGLYPVGAAAVAWAYTKKEAEHQLLAEWRSGHTGAMMPTNIEIEEFVQVGPRCRILLDGDY